MELIYTIAILIGLLIAFIIVMLKFRQPVINGLKWIFGKLKGIRKRLISIPAVMIIVFIAYMFAPDKIYYFVFLGIFVFCIYKLVLWLMDFVYVVSLDWTENNMQVIELTQKAFNSYQILDQEKKPCYITYWIKCKDGKIALVDSLDIKNKIMTVNPTVSNFEFLRNYKDVDMMMKAALNKLGNDLAKIQGEFEYKTIEKAKEMLENNSLLSTIVGEAINTVPAPVTNPANQPVNPPPANTGGGSSGK